MSGGSIQRTLDWLRPPPRIVDWSIFTAVTIAATTGIVSFLGVTPSWTPVFWIHRIVGLTLIVLLGFKLARVRYRITNTDQWQPTTALSVLTALVAFGTIGTGVAWVFGFNPEIPYFHFLSVHVGLGLTLFALMIVHQRSRFRPPRRVDFDRRRTSMQYSVMLVTGALTYRGQEAINNLLNTPGSERRLTGSRRKAGTGNGSFPPTSWVADDPDRIDLSEWSLTVTGAVERPRQLPYEELSPETREEALLDCTSGWYTVQEWRGVRVGELLDGAGTDTDAAYVRFVSVTGYRWSLPIDEARDALLATHVGDEPLRHGHGRPLRLVAPDRRGFQWVKWIDRVEVRHHGDPAQWLVTLISGFTE